MSENGKRIAQNKRFSLEPQLVVAQIDIERLRAERRLNSTFATAEALAKDEPRVIYCVEPAFDNKPFELLREINPAPFVPSTQIMQDRCEEIFNIQGQIQKRMEDNYKKGGNFIPFRLTDKLKELEALRLRNG